MRDAFKETGQRLWRLALPGAGAVVSLKFGELVATVRTNWTLALHEAPPSWLTEEGLAPWVQPALGIFIGASLVWALWPVVRVMPGWVADKLEERRMGVITIALGMVLMAFGGTLTWRGFAGFGASKSKAIYGAVPPANRAALPDPLSKPIVGGRAEDEPGKTTGPMPAAQAPAAPSAPPLAIGTLAFQRLVPRIEVSGTTATVRPAVEVINNSDHLIKYHIDNIEGQVNGKTVTDPSNPKMNNLGGFIQPHKSVSIFYETIIGADLSSGELVGRYRYLLSYDAVPPFGHLRHTGRTVIFRQILKLRENPQRGDTDFQPLDFTFADEIED